MKPETKAWLDKLVPLLVHVREGGQVSHGTSMYKWSKWSSLLGGNNGAAMIQSPELFKIHVEPRVIYVYEAGNGLLGYHTVLPPHDHLKGDKMVRFIEDLAWKPDEPRKAPAHPWDKDKASLDADHHLGEPSKQATDYMKTV